MSTEDPYRVSDASASPTSRVLAGPNRLRTIVHMTIVVALLSAGAYGLTARLPPALFWGLVSVMVAISFDLFRNVHEWLLPHRVTVDTRGVELVWSEKAPWRPWMLRKSAAIPWKSLREVRTSTVSVNGSDSTTLYLMRKDGPAVVIPDGVFGQSAQGIQTAILDERDDRIEAPRRQKADVAGFCQHRFESPLTLHLEHPWGRRVGGTFFASVMLAGGGWISAEVGSLASVVILGPAAFVAVVVLYATWSSSGPAVLQLSERGVAHGPSDDRLTILPWTEIRFARPIVINGRPNSVRIARKDGSNLSLSGNYGIPLGELAMLIDPPVDYVLAMRAKAKAGSTSSGTRPSA